MNSRSNAPLTGGRDVCPQSDIDHSAGTVAPAETWRVYETSLESSGDAGVDVEIDVVFENVSRTMRVPAFWDGGKTYRVRFAPPEPGLWNWRTECAAEKSLDGIVGTLDVKPYAGSLEIYRRGFVRAEPGRKYFTYADGTPFLYLGDTHWGFGREAEDDAAHPDVRHVETVAKRRVEQGFTVWQSEPLGCSFDLTDGTVCEKDIAGFRIFDRAFQVVADAGLVHANAEFFFPSAMKRPLSEDAVALRRLSRYWVARYGAYPVLWTLGQEVDNDFFYTKSWSNNKEWTMDVNPYVKVAGFIRSFDAYAHPLTAHQENTYEVSVTGRGTSAATNGDYTKGRSAFADADVAGKCGHTWWGAQWSPALDSRGQRFDMLQDYWDDPRVAVNYEGRYCGLWALDYGARAQAWLSFLSGFRGYGYGAADLWLFKSTYDMENPSSNEVETISVEEKHTPWHKALEYPSANQMLHFRRFMEKRAWWKLMPDFGSKAHFIPSEQIGGGYACAADGDNEVVVYVHDRGGNGTGRLAGLRPHATYRLERFDPQTGADDDLGERLVGADGLLALPERADANDWVYAARITDWRSGEFLDRRVVVSDTRSFTCGSAPVSCVSKDGKRIFAPYLTSRTGFGESHDIAAVADFAIDDPASAKSFVICERGETICGTQVEIILPYASFWWKDSIRFVLDINYERLCWRDWNPATKKIVGEGEFKCRSGGQTRSIRPQLVADYLDAKGMTGHNVFRERGDRMLFQSKPVWIDGILYGFVTSSCSQPVLFRCDDGETFEFIGVVPEIGEYETQLACLRGRFYAVMRGAKGPNFWISDDMGATFRPIGRVPDGLQRQQLMVWRDKILLGYSAPDEFPNRVRNGRNNFHLLLGEGDDLSDYSEIMHAFDPIGIVYYDLIGIGDDLHVVWSNSERFPTHVKWGAVQGKDQLLYAPLNSPGVMG